MKILHTSDWHLGHTLYNYDRTEEQLSMLKQVEDIVRKHQPDVFLLCGDIYHTSQPSAAVQTMLSEAIINIRNANPNMTMIITAGNHDSAARHEIFTTPWKALKVHTIGNLDRNNINKHIIKIDNIGYIIAIPYTYERNIPEGFFQEILDTVSNLNTENLPVVMTAHTTIHGCDFIGHDHATEYTVGGIDAFNIEQMGEGYDYLALGHIHHEQFIHTGKHNVRYSGTPIAINFDENYPHSISLVEIDKHGEAPRVTKIEISNPHPLVTLPTEGLTSWDEALNLLKNFPNDISAYIRLNVEIESFLPPNANAEALAIAQNKQCRFCYINAKRKSTLQTNTKTFTVQEFQAQNPIVIVQQYIEDSGAEFTDEIKTLFQEAITLMDEESRND
jgi:exonuclease SbcD